MADHPGDVGESAQLVRLNIVSFSSSIISNHSIKENKNKDKNSNTVISKKLGISGKHGACCMLHVVHSAQQRSCGQRLKHTGWLVGPEWNGSRPYSMRQSSYDRNGMLTMQHLRRNTVKAMLDLRGGPPALSGGDLYEFGVYTGGGLRAWVEALKTYQSRLHLRHVWGFDSFSRACLIPSNQRVCITIEPGGREGSMLRNSLASLTFRPCQSTLSTR